MSTSDATLARREIATVIPLLVATLIWVAALAVASFVPPLLGDDVRPAADWAAVALAVIVGVAWIVVQARYLSRLDELQRKVQTDALGVALGVGVVGGLSLALAENAGLIAVEADIAVLVVTVAVVYIVGVFVGQVRYR